MEHANGTRAKVKSDAKPKAKAKGSRKPISVQTYAAKHNVSEFRCRRTLRRINGGTLPKGSTRYALTAKQQTALSKALGL